MHRRDLLRAALALTVAGPAWPRPSPRARLRRLRDEAAAEGRGLLIALVPADDRREAARRGHLWGELLTRAGDVELADLYVVRRAAATTAELALPDHAFAAQYAPGTAAPRVFPHAALPARTRAAQPSALLSDLRSPERAQGLARALRGFLHPDALALEARRVDLEAALTTCPRLATLDRTRALRRLLEALRQHRLDGRDAPLRLAVGAVARHEGRPPAFSRAALEPVGDTPPAPGPHGCAGVPCGTAHVPAASRRFLRFYFRDDD